MPRRQTSIAGTSLWLLDLTADDDTYAIVLHTLTAGVNVASDKIDEAKRGGADDYAQWVVEEEVPVLDYLLGAAYLVCQAPITAVTQAALSARAVAVDNGMPFSVFNNAQGVRALGERFNEDYSKVEVLWALANYFKHRDEWNISTWESPTSPARFTVPVLLAVGLKPCSTDNLRTGAEALGNPRYDRMDVFEQIVRQWSEDVPARTRAAFDR